MHRSLGAFTISLCVALVPSGCGRAGGGSSVSSPASAAAPTTRPSIETGRSPTAPELGPRYAGCPVFPVGDSAYNADVRSARIDPNSSAYIASLGANDSWDNDTMEYLNIATDAPTMPVAKKVSWHAMPPQPWESSFIIEPASDTHSFVLATRSCHLYELYETTYAGGALSAYSGGNWDLRRPFVPKPLGQSSAVASGISEFAGAVKYRELASGQVLHALFLIAPYHSLSQWDFVRPGSSTDGIPYEGTGSVQLPYGAKLRLRSTYPESELGPQALAVVHALKTYGAIIGDTGCCYKFVFMNDASTSNAFDPSDLGALSSIQPSDWEVISLPHVYSIPGH